LRVRRQRQARILLRLQVLVGLRSAALHPPRAWAAAKRELPESRWFPALRAAPTAEQFYRDGKHPFGLSTPREMGRLLEMMERGTLVDKPSSDLMLNIMRGQLYRTRIPRYVTGYTIPHKTGDFLPYVGDDVGVLEAQGKTIVLSVFTGNHFGSGEMLENAIGLVARDVAEYFAYRP